MRDIIYAAPWSKDRKNSWSGTIYYLRESLQKNCSVYDIDTEVFSSRSPLVLAHRVITKVQKKMGVHKLDMNMSRMNLMDKVINIKTKNIPILQFEECPGIRTDAKQYIYQDLSAAFVKNLYSFDRALFDISGFQKNDISVILKRYEMQKYFYDHAVGIFTMSHWLHDYLRRGYGDKVHFAGGGINLNADLIDVSRRRGNKILFVGKDFERKNGPLVLEAFSIAKEIRPDIELYIAGPTNLGIDSTPGVHNLGRLTFDELAAYFNLCDIFCMPSKFEAYGIVFPEALSFGLPCIGRDAFEMPHFIEDGVTGYILKKENPYVLSELMLNLLENDEIKNNVRDRREFYLNEYSWDTVAKRMMEVIFK